MVSRELKVDFNRAFDSSNWEYLEEVMKCMGFGNKWIAVVHAWISGSQLVILINGPLMNTNFPRSFRLYQTHTEEYIPLSTRIHTFQSRMWRENKVLGRQMVNMWWTSK